jgi:glycosyltransferase involved in cell wall biosynthesis
VTDDERTLRVALLHNSYGTPYGGRAAEIVRELAHGLRAAGHDAVVLSSALGQRRRDSVDGVDVLRLPRLPEAPLRFRGFDGPLTHLPGAARELRRGGYDLAHAFSAQDAWAGRTSKVPTVFTCSEVLSRRVVANRRLRFRMLSDAVEQSRAVLALNDQARVALARWLAIEAQVVDPGDVEGHVAIYNAVLDGRRADRYQAGCGARPAPRRI